MDDYQRLFRFKEYLVILCFPFKIFHNKGLGKTADNNDITEEEGKL